MPPYLLAILAPASLEKSVDALQRQATAKDGPGILAIGEIKKTHAFELGYVFDGVAYTAGEKEEVEKMMAIGTGKHFNYSRDEIALIKKRADRVKDKIILNACDIIRTDSTPSWGTRFTRPSRANRGGHCSCSSIGCWMSGPIT